MLVPRSPSHVTPAAEQPSPSWGSAKDIDHTVPCCSCTAEPTPPLPPFKLCVFVENKCWVFFFLFSVFFFFLTVIFDYFDLSVPLPGALLLLLISSLFLALPVNICPLKQE